MRLSVGANKPPKLILLSSDKNSPQTAGSTVTWIADAKDPEKDPIFYRFFLNDDPVTKWTKDNNWVWPTNDSDVGINTIEVRIRDGKHSLANGYDDHKSSNFNITISKPASQTAVNKPPVVNSLTPDKLSPQVNRTVISWIANATDPDGDPLEYRFSLSQIAHNPLMLLAKGGDLHCSNGLPGFCQMRNWSKDSTWIWNTTDNDVGINVIKVEVRDGKNNLEGDDSKTAQFTINVAPNKPTVVNSLTPDKQSPQNSGTSISDQLQERFDGPKLVQSSVQPSGNIIAVPIDESEAIRFSGKGDGASQKFTLAKGLAIFSINHSIPGNGYFDTFSVELMNTDGTNKRYVTRDLVGGSNGTTASIVSTPGEYMLYVTSSDTWVIKITQPGPKTAQNVPVSFKGMGQQVSPFFMLRPGPITFKLDHDGKYDFEINLVDLNGNYTQVASESGIITGASKTINIKDSGIYCLEIKADGNWKIDVSEMQKGSDQLQELFDGPKLVQSSVQPSGNIIAVPIDESGAIRFSGKGDGASPKFTLAKGLAIFSINHSIPGNGYFDTFSVELMNTDGTNKRSVTGEDGTTASIVSTPGEYMLYVQSLGTWVVNITQPRPKTAQNVPVSFKGMGQQVSPFFMLRPGPITFKLDHDGKYDFEINLVDLNGNYTQVASESGIITDASKTINIKDSGIYCLEIKADGNWKIDVSEMQTGLDQLQAQYN